MGDIEIDSPIGIKKKRVSMVHLAVDQVWVEFPAPLRRRRRQDISKTGGEIDSERGIVSALQDISLDIREGGRIGLIGHNGSGKTTLLRVLAGVYSPTRGRVESLGEISTLFSTSAGLRHDGTGRENIVSCGLSLGMTPRDISGKSDEIIDFAELGAYIDLPVRTYSAGMLTRLGFSIATSIEPQILLIDEGLATGDAEFARKAQQKMQELIARSSILVIASHSHSLVSSLCTECVVMEHGKIIKYGPAQEVVKAYRETIILSSDANDPEAQRRAYELSVQAAQKGERPPITLEEQGLRHALRLREDDVDMWRRLTGLLIYQGKPVPKEAVVRIALADLEMEPDRQDIQRHLLNVVDSSKNNELPVKLWSRINLIRKDIDL